MDDHYKAEELTSTMQDDDKATLERLKAKWSSGVYDSKPSVSLQAGHSTAFESYAADPPTAWGVLIVATGADQTAIRPPQSGTFTCAAVCSACCLHAWFAPAPVADCTSAASPLTPSPALQEKTAWPT